jgi:protein-tyrosine-phosphatase
MKRVMFVCKKNSSRSQMVEGFAKTLGADKIEVTSTELEASSVVNGVSGARSPSFSCIHRKAL